MLVWGQGLKPFQSEASSALCHLLASFLARRKSRNNGVQGPQTRQRPHTWHSKQYHYNQSCSHLNSVTGIRPCNYTYLHMCTYACVHTHLYMHVNIYACMYICMCTYAFCIYACVHTHLYTYIYMHMYVYINIHVLLHIYMRKSTQKPLSNFCNVIYIRIHFSSNFH